jgi:hypothetical protein
MRCFACGAELSEADKPCPRCGAARFTQLYAGAPAAANAAAATSPATGAPMSTPAAIPADRSPAITRPLPPLPWLDAVIPAPLAPSRASSPGGSLVVRTIALLSYLGGFLLLVAALLFVLYGRKVLPDEARLAVVIAVHLCFGTAGLALWRVARLRIVGGVYLAVYALSLPLVGLAAYRFTLHRVGFPISGVLCITAIYAAVAYLALCVRLRLGLYGVFGLVAAALALIAGLAWAGLGAWWWPVGLAAMALGYVALGAFPRLAPIAPPPAIRLLAALALVGAELWTVAAVLIAQIRALATLLSQPAGLSLAFLIATALLTGWGLIWWGQQRRPTRLILPTLFLIQLAFAVLAQMQAGLLAYASVLLALATLAIVAARLAERHGWAGGLTLFLDSMGLLLTLAAAIPALSGFIYDPPLIAVLSVGVALSLIVTLARSAPWLLLIVGGFAGLDLAAIAPFIVGPELSAAAVEPLYLGLALLTAACGVTVGRRKGRRWEIPLSFTALALLAITYLLSIFSTPVNTALALLIGAGAAYVVAAGVEVWALPVACLLAAGSIPYLSQTLGWPVWADLAALGTLAALVAVLQLPWAALLSGSARATGLALHRWTGVALAALAALIAAILPGAFMPQALLALEGALLLLEAGALLALATWFIWRWGLLIAGFLAALALSWLARYLGLVNLQAYILVPGAYLVFAGVLLAEQEQHAGQALAIAGALLLTLTTLAQSFDAFSWLYASVIAGESLLLLAIGLSARQRAVTSTGVALVGMAALRGIFIAAGIVPIWAIVAPLGALLLVAGGLLCWWRGQRRPGNTAGRPT